MGIYVYEYIIYTYMYMYDENIIKTNFPLYQKNFEIGL